ncbi:MAG TPA: hypothetical protein PKL68_03375 [Actinomycetota bacterium]|nr:hypothetical protein [Actinomycetota bacterium]
MQTSSEEPQRSGSRWEPAEDEQVTEVLTPPPAAPSTPAASAPARRGISTTAAVLIAVLVGALGGAVAGVALTGDRGEQPVSGVVSEQGQVPGAEGQVPGAEGQVPGAEGQVPGAEGQFGGPGQGHHGFDGDHEGEFR